MGSGLGGRVHSVFVVDGRLCGGLTGYCTNGEIVYFRDNLKKLINLIDETEWTSLVEVVRVAACEGLHKQAANDGRKGRAGTSSPACWSSRLSA